MSSAWKGIYFMKKINIGAGGDWRVEGWDVLDNGPSEYNKPWKHRGKCWDTKLPSGTYDLVICSHMLEHVPHFRLEKTISEFNRITKLGGTVRILVPSLKKAAEAYVSNNVDFFSSSKHYSDHMGIGASFMRVVNSPGGQTIAMSREMDEFIGGYAHLYSFDFIMLKTVLEKWGFGDVEESEPGQSKIDEMREFQHLVQGENKYDMHDEFVREKKYLNVNEEWHYGGFDKSSKKQLIVEAKKVSDIEYSNSKEYSFHRVSRMDSPLDDVKIFIICWVCRLIDTVYSIYKRVGLNRVLRAFRR